MEHIKIRRKSLIIVHIAEYGSGVVANYLKNEISF